MIVAGKYRLEQLIGWSDGAEVHSGPVDPVRKQPVAVKIHRGVGGTRQPNDSHELFLRAVRDQHAAMEAGCRQVAPIYETGQDGDSAWYVTRRFPHSLESLIKGRVLLEPPALQRIATGVLKALEELRDRHHRTHGNLKPSNIFLEGKNAQSSTVFLGDLALPERAGGEAGDCYALGTVICQLVRGRAVRHFDWPIVASPEWERLESHANAWREFCNALMAPDLAMRPGSLAVARDAFRNMDRLGSAAEERSRDIAEVAGDPGGPPRRQRRGLWVGTGVSLAALTGSAALLAQPANSAVGQQLRSLPVLASLCRLLDAPAVPIAVPSPSPPQGSLSPTARASTPPSVSPTPSMSPGPGGPAATPALAMVAPTPGPATESNAGGIAAPTETSGTPTPTPDPREDQKDYLLLLTQVRQDLDDPGVHTQPGDLNDALTRLKNDVRFNGNAFVKGLPEHLDAAVEEPALPADRWKKDTTVSPTADGQGVAWTFPSAGVRMPFNRVTTPNGVFYVSAMTVPMQLGRVLAHQAKVTQSSGILGPTAWAYEGGSYRLRRAWLEDSASFTAYKGLDSQPEALSPMNGISAAEASDMAKAAGCSLPTLSQWSAILATPGGQVWEKNWRTIARVRGPAWESFAKDLKDRMNRGAVPTGVALPNDQCFGGHSNLDHVGPDSDSNLFFERVDSRPHEGYSHLIGNVGQYVTDDARRQFYFAGGSAESDPAYFASELTKPPLAQPGTVYADGGLRLVVGVAKSGAPEAAFTRLSDGVNTELARAQKL